MPSPLKKIYPKECLRQPHPLKARIRKHGILQCDLAELFEKLDAEEEREVGHE